MSYRILSMYALIGHLCASVCVLTSQCKFEYVWKKQNLSLRVVLLLKTDSGYLKDAVACFPGNLREFNLSSTPICS